MKTLLLGNTGPVPELQQAVFGVLLRSQMDDLIIVGQGVGISL